MEGEGGGEEEEEEEGEGGATKTWLCMALFLLMRGGGGRRGEWILALKSSPLFILELLISLLDLLTVGDKGMGGMGLEGEVEVTFKNEFVFVRGGTFGEWAGVKEGEGEEEEEEEVEGRCKRWLAAIWEGFVCFDWTFRRSKCWGELYKPNNKPLIMKEGKDSIS